MFYYAWGSPSEYKKVKITRANNDIITSINNLLNSIADTQSLSLNIMLV